jgi:predicted small secreted protein
MPKATHNARSTGIVGELRHYFKVNHYQDFSSMGLDIPIECVGFTKLAPRYLRIRGRVPQPVWEVEDMANLSQHPHIVNAIRFLMGFLIGGLIVVASGCNTVHGVCRDVQMAAKAAADATQPAVYQPERAQAQP